MLVDLQVLLEKFTLSKAESTDGARVSAPSAVNLFVAPQCSGSGKALLAEDAAERFNSSMAPHVCLHVLKHFPADPAGPASTTHGFHVRSQMV